MCVIGGASFLSVHIVNELISLDSSIICSSIVVFAFTLYAPLASSATIPSSISIMSIVSDFRNYDTVASVLVGI